MTLPVSLAASLTCMSLLLYLVVRNRRRRRASPLLDAYIFGLVLYAAGTIILAFQSVEWQPMVSLMALATLTTSASAATLLLVVVPPARQLRFQVHANSCRWSKLDRRFVAVSLVLSCLVTALFIYVALGRGALSAIVGNLIGSGGENFLEIRKSITSGSDGYLAPGYLKQFRDIMLPIGAMAIALGSAGRLWRNPPFLVACAVALFGGLLSGQRAPVLLFLGSLAFASLLRQRTGRLQALSRISVGTTFRKAWFPILLALGVLIMMTTLLGRVDAAKEGRNPIAASLSQIVGRIVTTVPLENMRTSHYWLQVGPTYGQAWLSDLASILPGTQQMLSNQLHTLIGGSEQGNATMGVAVDIWFSWGWVGILIVPVFYVLSVYSLDRALSSGRSPLALATRLHLLVWLPFMYSPFLFLLYGGLVATLNLSVLLVLKRRHQHSYSFTSNAASSRQLDESFPRRDEFLGSAAR